MSGANPEPDPVPFPITGELDLHLFRPKDVPELLPEYFRECRAAGLTTVRVIHGKGTGTLREGVHRLLGRMTAESSVKSWTWPAGDGGWGATMVFLET